MAEDEEQAQKRTPFSARLPQVSLDDALESVRALAELGAPSTPHVIAQHVGTSYATNTRFRTRLGAAGYYGLIERKGGKRVLTERGAAIASGDGDAGHARREAVMSTGFGPVIYSLRGRPVNESAITLRLQGDYAVPAASAPSVAQALIAAATQAALIKDNRFDAAEIESVASALPPETPAPVAPTAKPRTVTTEERRREATPQARQRRQQPEPQPEVAPPRPFAPSVQVVVKIDASSLTPQEIAELVRALQAPAA